MASDNATHATATAAAGDIRLLVLDLDGTLLHGADTFEGRFLTQRTVDACMRAHDAGIRIAVSTARPVSTGLAIVRRLPVDACVYLNGALIDFDPRHSTYESLTGGAGRGIPQTADIGTDADTDGSIVRVGFDSARACEVCRMIVAALPGIQCGIVMDDVRYTNFDVSAYWKTQTWRYTDFTDVPAGVADKIILFPREHERGEVRRLVPDDFSLSVSEGVLYMLMNPRANKRDALATLCTRLGVDPGRTAAFGDDLVDIGMMRLAGRGVAVANAVPEVLEVADEVCPANDEDGVAQWIDAHLDAAHAPDDDDDDEAKGRMR